MPARKQVMRIFPQDIPDKIYYSISEVSEYTRVEPHVLRYWETKFTKLAPKRVGGNQRKYTRSDLDLLFVIIHLLYNEGFTLDGAERKIRDPETYELMRQQYGISGSGRQAPSAPVTQAAPDNDRPRKEAEPVRRGNGSRHKDLREIKAAVKAALKDLQD